MGKEWKDRAELTVGKYRQGGEHTFCELKWHGRSQTYEEVQGE